MKAYSRLVRTALFAAPFVCRVFAQAPVSPTPPAESETITLSPFIVNPANVGRYQSNEAASATRVRVSLLDSTQNVSVVTRELIEDVGAGRILDAAKYVAGVGESTIPNAQDRTNIRGFQADGAIVDGFGYFSFANLDPVLIDRIEVVKGPNAILAPQGVPGGTINSVTKRPTWVNSGYISGQVGEYNSNRVEVDVNNVLKEGKLALRVVGALQKTDDYPGGRNFHRSNMVAPMLTYRFSRDTELTVQLEAYDFRVLNNLGLPIDPYVGTQNEASIVRGVSPELVPYDDDTYRYQKALHGRVFFTSNFNDHFSTRAAAHWLTSTAISNQSNLGNNGGNVALTRGVTGDYDAAGNWIPNFATPPSRIYTRSYGVGPQSRRNFDFQNDYVYKFALPQVASTTTAGYWLSQARVRDLGYSASKTNIDIDNYSAGTTVVGALNNQTITTSRTLQGYANENLALFDNRLIVNGAVARAYYQQHVNDQFRSLTAKNDPSATLPSWGAVLKPMPQVALFYGVSKQSTAIGPSTTSVIPNKLQTSRQNEYGIRLQVLENKLYATWSHFDIKQNNFSIPNPANLVVPTPNPPFPALFTDRVAKGWEFELRASLTPEWSLVGNYANFTNRSTPYGQVYRGVAEKAGAVWTSYSFKKGALKGLMVGIGLDYLGERPGDNPAAPFVLPSGAVVIPQPSFWLPARTLVNASVSYALNSHWKTQINVENLTDKEYLAAAIGRQAIWPGAPINARLTVRYDF